MKKRILLLTTGGTIASQDGGNGLAPVLSSDDFLDYMKEFEDVCELVPYEVCSIDSVSYTHLRAHETRHDLVCRLLLEKKKNPTRQAEISYVVFCL